MIMLFLEQKFPFYVWIASFFLGHSYKITCNFNHCHCTWNDVCLYIYMYINCFHSGELSFKGPDQRFHYSLEISHVNWSSTCFLLVLPGWGIMTERLVGDRTFMGNPLRMFS